jgi:hypothetical protein
VESQHSSLSAVARYSCLVMEELCDRVFLRFASGKNEQLMGPEAAMQKETRSTLPELGEATLAAMEQ